MRASQFSVTENLTPIQLMTSGTLLELLQPKLSAMMTSGPHITDFIDT